MSDSPRFQQRKFLALSTTQQHKKCAEILRRLHLKECPELFDYYQELQWWLKKPLLPDRTKETLCNRYHDHLQQAGLSLKEHDLLPSIRQQDRKIAAAPWPISVYLDHLRSAHNVGSIIRTMEAFSLGELCLGGSTPTPGHKKVKDTAMGADQWISWHQRPIEELPRPIIGLETSDSAIFIYDFIFPEQFTLVVGNEEYGISQKILNRCDYLVEIPLRGKKNYINVANAFAIAAGQIALQKRLYLPVHYPAAIG